MIETFHKLQLAEIQHWWELGVPFVEKPTDSWCEYVCEKENVYCFCSLQEGRIATYSQTDVENGIGYIAIVTHPLLSRCGHATKHLGEAEQRLAILGVRKLIAAIETDNHPSIAFFERNGYRRFEGADSESRFVDFEKGIPQSA